MDPANDPRLRQGTGTPGGLPDGRSGSLRGPGPGQSEADPQLGGEAGAPRDRLKTDNGWLFSLGIGVILLALVTLASGVIAIHATASKTNATQQELVQAKAQIQDLTDQLKCRGKFQGDFFIAVAKGVGSFDVALADSADKVAITPERIKELRDDAAGIIAAAEAYVKALPGCDAGTG